MIRKSSEKKSVNPKVFISKERSVDSPYLQRLLPANWEFIGFSLLHFEALEFAAPPTTDWVFFYSQRGVHFFLSRQTPDESTRLAAIGKATAEAIRQYGYSVDFIGNGHPEQVATAFEELAYGQLVLFPRARRSRQSIQQLLHEKIDVLDLVIYDNNYRTDFEIPACHYVILTSPMNVEAFFNKYQPLDGQRFIAIGKTTAATLNQFDIHPYKTAEAPTEEALAQCLLAWENESASRLSDQF